MSHFIKVEEHRGKPLSKAADALAGLGAAAEMDLTRPVDVDAEGVYFYYLKTLVAWSTRLLAATTSLG